MKILLRGYYGFGNFGDDLLLISCYSIIRRAYPSADIHVFANYTEGLRNFKAQAGYRNYLHDLLGDSPRLIDWRDVDSFDLEVLGGGGVFKPGRRSLASVGGNLIPASLGARHTTALLAFARTAFNRPARTAASDSLALGVGIEKYDLLAGNLLRDIERLGRLSQIHVRDSESARNLSWLGLSSRVGTDLAFEHHDRFRAKQVDLCQREGVGVVLSAGKPRNEDTLALLERELTAEAITLVFFEEFFDHDLIHSARRRGFRTLTWRPTQMSLDEFVGQYAKFSLVISNRFHGIITAALLGIPSITLETDSKLKSLAEILPRSTYQFTADRPIGELATWIRRALSGEFISANSIKYDVETNKERLNQMIHAAFGA